jgi:hypothetical protein
LKERKVQNVCPKYCNYESRNEPIFALLIKGFATSPLLALQYKQPEEVTQFLRVRSRKLKFPTDNVDNYCWFRKKDLGLIALLLGEGQ